MIDLTSVVYVENDTELSWLFTLGVTYDKNQIGNNVTWPIILVWSMSKSKLNYHDLSNKVRSIMITRQDNDMIDCIGVVYAESKLNYRDLSNRVRYVMKDIG